MIPVTAACVMSFGLFLIGIAVGLLVSRPKRDKRGRFTK